MLRFRCEPFPLTTKRPRHFLPTKTGRNAWVVSYEVEILFLGPRGFEIGKRSYYLYTSDLILLEIGLNDFYVMEKEVFEERILKQFILVVFGDIN